MEVQKMSRREEDMESFLKKLVASYLDTKKGDSEPQSDVKKEEKKEEEGKDDELTCDQVRGKDRCWCTWCSCSDRVSNVARQPVANGCLNAMRRVGAGNSSSSNQHRRMIVV